MQRIISSLLTFLLLFSFPLQALADNIQNTDVNDVAIGGNVTTTVGNSTTINYLIRADASHNLPGCDADDGSDAKVNINFPANVTASPTSLDFNSCDTSKAVVFSSSVAGDYPITVSVEDANGVYNTEPAKFTLRVSAEPVPTDITPPVIVSNVTPEPNASGWNNSDVTVSFTVTDPESAITSQTGCDNAVVSEDTVGTTFTCSATSSGGTDSKSVTVKLDKATPIITAGDPVGTLSLNDWYTSEVTVPFSATDNLSGFNPDGALSIDLASKTTVGEGENLTVTSDSVSDLADNNTLGLTAGPFKVDTTAPEISFVGADPNANLAGWNNTPVTLTWGCSDVTSGPAEPTVSQTISSEGENQSATGTCADNAGLTSTNTHSGINIDTTAPTITSSDDGAKYILGQQAAPAVPNCQDNLSGVATTCQPSVSTLDTSTAGFHSYTVTSTDNAGNTSVKTITYDVFKFVGLFSPIKSDLKTFQKPSTIPVKFQLTDGLGNFWGAPLAKLYVAGPLPLITTSDAVSSGSSNSLNQFRYDASAQQYIYNLKTATLIFKSGFSYNLIVSIEGAPTYINISPFAITIK